MLYYTARYPLHPLQPIRAAEACAHLSPSSSPSSSSSSQSEPDTSRARHSQTDLIFHLSRRESERYYWSQRFSIFSLQRKVWSTWSTSGSGQLFQVHAWMFISFHLSFEFHHCNRTLPLVKTVKPHRYQSTYIHGDHRSIARKMCITAPRLRSVSPALVVGSDPSVHVPVSFPVNWDGSLRCAATDTQTAAGESDTCSFNYNLLLFLYITSEATLRVPIIAERLSNTHRVELLR